MRANRVALADHKRADKGFATQGIGKKLAAQDEALRTSRMCSGELGPGDGLKCNPQHLRGARAVPGPSLLSQNNCQDPAARAIVRLHAETWPSTAEC